MNVEIENSSDSREHAQRWDRDAAAPKLHVAFAHVEPPCGGSGTDASPLQGCVEACRDSAPEAIVLTATLEVLDGLSASIHVI